MYSVSSNNGYGYYNNYNTTASVSNWQQWISICDDCGEIDCICEICDDCGEFGEDCKCFIKKNEFSMGI